MALAYAFIDEEGRRHGEDSRTPPDRTFVLRQVVSQVSCPMGYETSG
jgi:hypothetical protein